MNLEKENELLKSVIFGLKEQLKKEGYLFEETEETREWNKRFKEDIEIARKNPTWNCRFHPTSGWHTVGCPHINWTAEQLQNALESQIALVRFYQHELFGTALDGKPIISQSTPSTIKKG